MNTLEPSTRHTLQQLWRLTKPQHPLFASAAIAMLVANLCLFAPPMLGKFAIDLLTDSELSTTDRSEVRGKLWLYGTLSVVITLCSACFMYVRGRCTALAAEGVARHLRMDLYNKLHTNTASFFDRSQTGDLVQRCSSDVETVRVFLASNLIDITRSLVLLIGVTPVLFWIDAALAWVSLGLIPLIVIGSYLFFAHAKALFLATDEAEGRMTSCLQENLTGIRVVRAFNRQAYEIEKFAICNADYRQCDYRLSKVMSYFWALSDLVSFTQLGIVLIVGAWFVQSSSLSVGDLFAFMTYVGMVIWPLRHLGRVLVDSGKSMVAVNRINHILSQDDEIAGIVPEHKRASGTLSIRDLSLTYPFAESTTTPALSNINLDIQAGETIALVGTPGSGKSTLMAALLKLYDYQGGSIKLDNHELKQLDRHWLRAQFAVVFQEPFLFSRSIANNLKVGNEHSSEERMISICSDAALHESILGFEDQYQSLIGERGVTLSGGQRQRLALARALLKDAPFLLLDDALSAVDSQTEKTILNAMQTRRGKQTTLIAAHRLSTIRHADRIALFEAGRIVQLGTHDELANVSGPYQRLCLIQGSLDNTISAELEALHINT